jgi:hypothetical protein
VPAVRVLLGVLGAVALLYALTVGVLAAFPGKEAWIAEPIDFLAFDCAAKVGASGADPYLAEPLRSCERDALWESHIKIVPNLVVPAPLPPYALAIFSILSRLAFRAASGMWFALGLIALGATVVLLRKLTNAPILLLAVVLLLADAFASIPIGQLVPLVLCALCGVGLALRAERPALAAALTLPLMLEPHVGLPVALALFVWEPRARRPLLVVAAVLGVLSLSEGFGRNFEYLRVVLPAQARGEGLEFGGQYSLSALLAALGVGASLALALGTASYVAMMAAGIALAGRLAKNLEDRSLVALVPPACVVFGGTYVHIHQMAFALPLTLLLVMRRPRLRALTVAALFALAIPWETLGEIPGIGPAHKSAHHIDIAAQLARVSAGTLPAEEAWGVWVRSGERDSRTAWERFEFKVPTWLGLGLLLGAALLVARECDGLQPLRPAGRRRAVRRSAT